MPESLEITLPALHRGRARVLAPCHLSLAPGEVVALVGPNGAGKTTLLQAIAGLAPERARLCLGGRALDRAEIGFLPQAFAVRAGLSVLDCLLLGQREALGLRVAPRLIAEAEALLCQLGLADLADRAMHDLSGGQQQRVLIAQRLFRRPKLLALDEPTSALDLHHQLEVMALLRTQAQTTSAPVLAALHDLSLAARYADRVLVLAGGQIEADGAPEAVLTPERLAQHWRIAPEILRARDGKPVIVPHLSPALVPDR
ncbi:ABC transporter ATP-binding protein [Rhodobacter maris]|uniref:Iron complex transport system ATP-binding protein n=1 Tax=Rhodobacter maris TaxID=446682 RepID=A0A285TBQ1_9RHOB|nr:ABC transporter ATP-binding protein [Rhodobacter maris]SOC17036.1 iron complex transport system ATP-binding protein [Rhodobacter maris]